MVGGRGEAKRVVPHAFVSAWATMRVGTVGSINSAVLAPGVEELAWGKDIRPSNAGKE